MVQSPYTLNRMASKDSPKHFPFLIGSAVFAFLWTVARASIQSVTIDEADTYLQWVSPADPAHWGANANNHVLNSLLMRLVTSIFGGSAITLRAPALVGAALYIGAVYCLTATHPAVGAVHVPYLQSVRDGLPCCGAGIWHGVGLPAVDDCARGAPASAGSTDAAGGTAPHLRINFALRGPVRERQFFLCDRRRAYGVGAVSVD
jgi:hypothetical protein